MNNNKVHSQRTVPFAWENRPEVRKDSKDDHHQFATSGDHGDFPVTKPPTPPYPPENSRASFHHELQIPPPPCPNFQQPWRRSSSRRSFRKSDDPFLRAYKECTKSTKKDHKWSSGVISRSDGGFGLKKNLSIFSCKRSSTVIDDSIVKASQLPISKSQRES